MSLRSLRAALAGVAVVSIASLAAFGTTTATFSARDDAPGVTANVACTRYLSAVHATNPEIVWNGDERTTAVVTDSAGNDTGEMLRGLTADQDTGDCGGSFNAPTNSDATLIGTKAYWNPQALTTAVWVKQLDPNGGRLLGFTQTRDMDDPGANDRNLWVTSSGFTFGLNRAGSPETVSCAANLVGTWHHLVATTSPENGTRLYLDGSLCAANVAVNSPLAYNGHWRLGSAFLWWWPGVTAQGWPGPVANAAIWHRELAAPEIHDIYNAADDPTFGTPTVPGLPITTMWLWDNSVTRAEDSRGTEYAPAEPATVAQFAADHSLTTVYVTAPWYADDDSPVDVWLDETTAALHAAGVREVGVVGGGADWLDDPNLAVSWAGWAVADRPVHHVQLEIEPWSGAAYGSWMADRPGTIQKWLTAIDATKASLPAGVTLGVAIPYWLGSESAPGGGSLTAAILDRVDSVAIITYFDHADGADGIIAMSQPAVADAVAKGVPFTIGVETDTAAIAGGPQYTFHEEGPAVLDVEVAKVHQAFGTQAGYRGVAVEHYRAWRDLLGL